MRLAMRCPRGRKCQQSRTRYRTLREAKVALFQGSGWQSTRAITSSGHGFAAAAGLPAIRLHDDAHHTAASLLAQNRVEIGVAAALLGHDPVVYLQTYLHPYEDAKRAATETLAAVYRLDDV